MGTDEQTFGRSRVVLICAPLRALTDFLVTRPTGNRFFAPISHLVLFCLRPFPHLRLAELPLPCPDLSSEFF